MYSTKRKFGWEPEHSGRSPSVSATHTASSFEPDRVSLITH